MKPRPETENVEGQKASEPEGAFAQTEQHTVIPVLAEELVVGRKAVRTGAVRVHKRVQERIEHIDLPLLKDTVEVQRIVINRVVEAPPPVRKEGNTIIVPVVEEEILVTKRLILKEEVHLIRRRTKTRAPRDVIVSREEAEVERVDAQGRKQPGRASQEAPSSAVASVPRRNRIIPDD